MAGVVLMVCDHRRRPKFEWCTYLDFFIWREETSTNRTGGDIVDVASWLPKARSTTTQAQLAPKAGSARPVVYDKLAHRILFALRLLLEEGEDTCILDVHASSMPVRIDAMLENEYGCEAAQSVEWEEETARTGRECRVRGRDVLAERGLS
ncbi:hypothetical protein KSP40_PGU015652 [Platanthera guangdongensis]|uniref:Uncharacterized protein n=1 Tax=Platanthera guangdongensis TaxID=2320717 RepID=A0ABR2M6L0_9ASPA